MILAEDTLLARHETWGSWVGAGVLPGRFEMPLHLKLDLPGTG
jgi:hypothetical protein